MQVIVQTSQRDLQRNKNRASATTAHVQLDADGGVTPGQAMPGYGWDLREVVAMAPSPSGKRMLIVRAGDDK
eukprot:3637805-Pyramimonas_sp.AAC.1